MIRTVQEQREMKRFSRSYEIIISRDHFIVHWNILFTYSLHKCHRTEQSTTADLDWVATVVTRFRVNAGQGADVHQLWHPSVTLAVVESLEASGHWADIVATVQALRIAEAAWTLARLNGGNNEGHHGQKHADCHLHFIVSNYYDFR